MGGTKIMVVQLKEVIKSAVFAVLGLILIILLIYFFLPKDREPENGTGASLYQPGTYTAQIVIHNSPVDVLVTLGESTIEAIEMQEMADAQEIFYPLLAPTLDEISREIIENQSLEIALEGDNAMTRKILLDAIGLAVAQGEI